MQMKNCDVAWLQDRDGKGEAIRKALELYHLQEVQGADQWEKELR